MSSSASTFDDVKAIVVNTLGIESRAHNLSADMPLMTSVPEFDSMAVLQVMLAIEEHFGITIENEDVTEEVFENLVSLAAFVDHKLA